MAGDILFLRLGFQLILLWWISHVHNQVHCLYFAKENDEVQILSTCTSTSDTFYEGFVLRSSAEPSEVSIDFCLRAHKNNSWCNVTSSSFNSSTFFSSSDQIGIREAPNGSSQTFHLYARRPIKKRMIAVEICAKNKDNRPHQAPCLKLKIRFFNESEYCHQLSLFTSCFGHNSSDVNLSVYENLEPQPIARIGQNLCLSRAKCGSHLFNKNVNYRITETNVSNQYVKLTNDGVLEVTSFDRERINEIIQTVTCVTSLNDDSSASVHIKISIKDENEHGPVVVTQNNSPKIINVSANEQGLKELINGDRFIGAQDLDSEPSNYSVEILDDKKGLFNVSHEVIIGNFNTTIGNHQVQIIKAKLHKIRDINYEGNSYTFRVRFVDLDLKKPGVSPEDTLFVVLQKHINTNADFSILDNIIGEEYEATLIQTAANHSRVEAPQMLSPELRQRSGVRFYLEQSTPMHRFPLDITPSHGIIYVNDTHALRRMTANQSFRLKMCWRLSDEADDSDHEVTNHVGAEIKSLGHVWINIKLIQNEELNAAGKDQVCNKDNWCSFYNFREHCESSCGPGAVTSFCQWRGQEYVNVSDGNAMNLKYSTCTPDIATCPDNKCDELESLFYHLCPQDCVLTKSVHGENVGHKGDLFKGIPLDSTGVCTCASTTMYCNCNPPSIFAVSHDDNAITSDSVINYKNFTPNVEEITHERPPNDELSCGLDCALSIVVVTLISTVLITLAVCFCRKRYGRKLRGGHKFPGSLVSIPAIPSDYVDERSSSVVSQNLLVINDVLCVSTTKLCAVDSKWEFPRSRLILEQTLGEGEFGRVVRARAFNILSHQPGYTTVAVKMLKSNGSSSEQDLLSEFNLLKEVCHPNVIRLLGICTDKEGPLCIIVEYAEFGALRTFLRKSRRLEFKSCTSDDSGVDSMANGVQAEPTNWSDYQVNSRDLLSFGWQIAKGMEYLSLMKLVHRDLAARNILVAANKAVKISDFGMTRDVYEGDTYFKKSMGRVPVKWLAIESLLDHIYTTKSDVWSFGIVLWEIVTLGAAPYPGVAPERLYHLLKSGYRMEKPDNCSDELYDIMRRCWREIPGERPSFAELTKIFDQMLQANVEYLDLGVNIVHNITYFEDIPLQTETIDEEGDDSEMGYGSWNALPNDDDDQYLTSNPPPSKLQAASNGDKEKINLLVKPIMLPKIVHCSEREIEEHSV